MVREPLHMTMRERDAASKRCDWCAAPLSPTATTCSVCGARLPGSSPDGERLLASLLSPTPETTPSADTHGAAGSDGEALWTLAILGAATGIGAILGVLVAPVVFSRIFLSLSLIPADNPAAFHRMGILTGILFGLLVGALAGLLRRR